MSTSTILRYLTFLIVMTVHLRPSSAIPPHAAVVGVEAEEAHLPPELKSQALQNPRLRQELVKSSWFHRGENPVSDREAEKISRKGIYNILIHAGFVSREGGHQGQSGLQDSLGHQAFSGLQGPPRHEIFSGLQGSTGHHDLSELPGPLGHLTPTPNYFHEPELSLQFI